MLEVVVAALPVRQMQACEVAHDFLRQALVQLPTMALATTLGLSIVER